MQTFCDEDPQMWEFLSGGGENGEFSSISQEVLPFINPLEKYPNSQNSASDSARIVSKTKIKLMHSTTWPK
jgi:hypothetical protein